MSNLSLKIHPEAIAEAAAARQWYQMRSHEAAGAFLAELDLGVKSIRDNPEIYPLYLHETRRYLLHRFPYLLIYRTTSTTIQIVAIAHSRRQPGYWKTRDSSLRSE
jgi:plasmid stabilization system protein ParE